MKGTHDETQIVERVRRIVQQGSALKPHEHLSVMHELMREPDSEKAFDTYRRAMLGGPNFHLRTQPVVSQLERAEAEALQCHIVDPGGVEVNVVRPGVDGEAKGKMLQGVTRRVFAACFRDAIAYPKSTTVKLADGTFAFDLQGAELDAIPPQSSHDPVVFRHNEDGSVSLIDDMRPSTLLRLPAAISLLGTFSVSFGDWILEEFARFLMLRRIEDVKGLPILVDANIPRQHVESLIAFTQPDFPIIEVPRHMRVQAGKLWIASNWFFAARHRKVQPQFGPESLVKAEHSFARLMSDAFSELEVLTGATVASGRVFVARDLARHRKLVNHAQVSAALAGRGFEEILPENLSFTGQFIRYRSASHVVVQAGSAVAGMYMCRPGTRVLLLTNGQDPFEAHALYYLRAFGLKSLSFTGSPEGGAGGHPERHNYHINMDAFSSVLDAFLEDA